MDTQWGSSQPEDRRDNDGGPADAETSLPPETVAEFIAWLATAPAALVVNETTITPLRKQGWP